MQVIDRFYHKIQLLNTVESSKVNLTNENELPFRCRAMQVEQINLKLGFIPPTLYFREQ